MKFKELSDKLREVGCIASVTGWSEQLNTEWHNIITVLTPYIDGGRIKKEYMEENIPDEALEVYNRLKKATNTATDSIFDMMDRYEEIRRNKAIE